MSITVLLKSRIRGRTLIGHQIHSFKARKKSFWIWAPYLCIIDCVKKNLDQTLQSGFPPPWITQRSQTPDLIGLSFIHYGTLRWSHIRMEYIYGTLGPAQVKSSVFVPFLKKIRSRCAPYFFSKSPAVKFIRLVLCLGIIGEFLKTKQIDYKKV